MAGCCECGDEPSGYCATELVTVRISGESPCGEVRALVRFGGRVDWWVEYKAAIGGKQYDAPGSYTATLRAPCSECTCTVYCGCCDNVLH
jgi:hypothetical protein